MEHHGGGVECRASDAKLIEDRMTRMGYKLDMSTPSYMEFKQGGRSGHRVVIMCEPKRKFLIFGLIPTDFTKSTSIKTVGLSGITAQRLMKKELHYFGSGHDIGDLIAMQHPAVLTNPRKTKKELKKRYGHVQYREVEH